jgi:hypothetical protein
MTEHVHQTIGDDIVDTEAHRARRAADPVAEFSRMARGEGRTCPVTANYHLSEEGRKASLFAGGDGRAVQEITVQVPTNRFHLVTVDDDGQARLRLRPRYSLNTNQDVIRDDAPPTYDTVPTVEDLLKEAARNHQLERAYRAERAERQRKRREVGFEAHQQLAERFLADPTLRALEHPKPTPRHCYVAGPHHTVLFDAKRNLGLARQVPPEAYRRFCADFRARTEKHHDVRARQLAAHSEKERRIAEWVAAHGTPDQEHRYAAGMLPDKEALEGLADIVFAAAGDRPRYLRDGLVRLQAHLRQFPQYGAVAVTKAEFLVSGAHADHATDAQWAFVRELQTRLPDATVTLRLQRMLWTRDPQAPPLTVCFVLVTQQVGSLTLRREYLAPND